MKLILWKHDNEYYATIEGSGWFLDTWGLAYVSGDDQQIDIIAMQTLPGDRSFGICERYVEVFCHGICFLLSLIAIDGQLLSSISPKTSAKVGVCFKS